jgi:hypothetical protein
MPPWPSFHVIDGAVETAALVSPWLSTTISLFWAIVAFHVGRALIEACWGPARGAVLEGPIPDLINREWFPTLAALAALGVAGFISGVMPHHPDLPEGVIHKSHEGLHGAHIHDHHNKIPTTEFTTRKVQDKPISLTEWKSGS